MATNDQVQQRQFTTDEIESRFSYHAPSGEAIGLHQEVREIVKDMAYQLNDLLPDGREKALAFTALESVGFNAHAAIARDPGLHDKPAQG